jgi:hypothetical protein
MIFYAAVNNKYIEIISRFLYGPGAARFYFYNLKFGECYKVYFSFSQFFLLQVKRVRVKDDETGLPMVIIFPEGNSSVQES